VRLTETARVEAGSLRDATLALGLVASLLLVCAPLAGPAAASAGASDVVSEIAYATAAGAIGTIGSASDAVRLIGTGADPHFSPDGSMIAYAGTRAPGLYVVDADGRRTRRITREHDSHPTWSPDGSTLAFARAIGRRSSIYVVGIDGRGLRRLTSGDVHDSQPDWSPNGSLIAFTRTSSAHNSQVVTLSPHGGGLHVLVAGSTPAFAPNGAQIAFTTPKGQIAVIDLDGSGRQELATGTSPSWSPDGATIAFTRTTGGGQGGIWRIDANGSGLTRLWRVPLAVTLSWQPQPGLQDWPQFGYEPGMSDDDPSSTGITLANLGSISATPTRVALQGTVDSSPIYLQGVEVAGQTRNVFVVQTTYGRAYAIDAHTARILWEYSPPGIAGWNGSLEITTASPAADPDRRYVYTASPNGFIHKLDLSNGSEVTGGGWPVEIVDDPTKEKISSSLAVYGDDLYASTAGLSIKIGSDTPRQGHLVAIDTATGTIAHVFYSECSGNTTLVPPTSCPQSRGGIHGRAPATFEPDGDILVATGNGPWDGKTYWGDSVLELDQDLRPLQNFTPTDQAELEANDSDLGSSSPALVGDHYAVQAGKDGQLKLLDLNLLNGREHEAGPYLGGQLQTIQAPGGGDSPGGCEVLTQPAVWNRTDEPPLVFEANDCGVAAYELLTTPTPHLVLDWFDARPGTSPVIAGGVLYVYDPDPGGGLNVYNPDPTEGHMGEDFLPLLTLPVGLGHWESPIVADGEIAVGEGNANDHQTTGVLDIFRLKAASSA